MTCPVCYSAELDPDAHCGFCGSTLSVADELRLRAALPAPATKRIEDERFEMALRDGGD